MVWLELINVAKKKKENRAFHSSEESSLQNQIELLDNKADGVLQGNCYWSIGFICSLS
jgi:hypothetical protein